MESPQALTAMIVEAIRKAAADYDSFGRNSVIRIAISPLSGYATQWLDPTGKLGSNYSFEYATTLDPDYDIRSDIIHGELNCYGFAALKMALCRHNIAYGYGTTSHESSNSSENFLVPENGYGSYRGCVSFLIKSRIEGIPESTPWARIFVCVSGGKQLDDEACAKTAKDAIRSAFPLEKYVVT